MSQMYYYAGSKLKPVGSGKKELDRIKKEVKKCRDVTNFEISTMHYNNLLSPQFMDYATICYLLMCWSVELVIVESMHKNCMLFLWDEECTCQ